MLQRWLPIPFWIESCKTIHSRTQCANAFLQIFKWKPTVLSLMVLRNTIRDKVFLKKPQYFSKYPVNFGSKYCPEQTKWSSSAIWLSKSSHLIQVSKVKVLLTSKQVAIFSIDQPILAPYTAFESMNAKFFIRLLILSFHFDPPNFETKMCDFMIATIKQTILGPHDLACLKIPRLFLAIAFCLKSPGCKRLSIGQFQIPRPFGWLLNSRAEVSFLNASNCSL